MPVTQDTITNAGLGMDTLSQIRARLPEQFKRQQELGQQQAAIGTEQERLMQEKTKAMEPLRAQMAEESTKIPTAFPKDEPIPEYRRPTVNPKELHDTFGVLMAATMLVGAASRTPFYGTMEAMTGAMNGFMQGDKNVVDESMRVYDENLKSIKERNAQMRQEFNDAWAKHQNNLGALKQQLELIGAKYDDPMMLNAARQKTVGDALKAGENNINNMMRMEYQMEMMQHKLNQSSKNMGQASQQAVRSAAWDYIIRGHNPPAYGGMYEKTMEEVGRIAKENNMTVDQLITASADVKARLSARRTIETRVQNLERAENQLKLEIPVMQDAMKAIDSPSIPAAARGKITVLRAMGDPKITTLDQAASTILNEFEGIVTGNPGTLNVSDVEHAKETYKNIQTTQQMQAWIDGARRIIDNASKANQQTRKEFLGQIRTAVGLPEEPTPSEKPARAGKAKPLSLDDYLKSKGH